LLAPEAELGVVVSSEECGGEAKIPTNNRHTRRRKINPLRILSYIFVLLLGETDWVWVLFFALRSEFEHA